VLFQVCRYFANSSDFQPQSAYFSLILPAGVLVISLNNYVSLIRRGRPGLADDWLIGAG
jgi:hypothetical protein